ncbi:MAG: energy transducer TonB [Wenzhouxiangellaceae bacterium]
MTNGLRYLVAGVIAVVVTLAAFYLMHRLISGATGERERLEDPPGIRFGPVEIDQDFQTKRRRKPEPPPPPDTPPPPPDISVTEVQQVRTPMPDLDLPDLNLSMHGGPPVLTGAVDRTAEGDVVPIVRIQPQYPREAAMKGIEGYVTIEFTITPTGTVRNPRVIDARPRGLFEREAIRAILRWKFKPRIVDGVAVERQATQTIEFNLDEAG